MIHFPKTFLQLKSSLGCLSSSFYFSLLTPQPQQSHDLIFIRHAESSFNQACEEYRQKNNIPYIWDKLCTHKDFDRAVLFNSSFIDCPLTVKGVQQSKKAKETLKNQNVDCVLVSPHLRALETCQNIFENRNIPIIVEPLLVGPLRSSSDVNQSTLLKRKKYPGFDFSALEKQDELWFLNHLHQEKRQLCLRHFHKNKITDLEQKRVELLKLMRLKKVFQDPSTYRKRIRQLKKVIENHKKKYKMIAIVTHYYTIQYLHATKYEEDGSPSFSMDIKNCHPYYCSSAHLTKNSEK